MADGLDQEKIDALWATFAADVDRMMERVNDPMDFAPGVLKARVTSDPGKLLYPSLHAQWLMKDLVDLVERRGKNPFEQMEQAAADRARWLRLRCP
ncbi:hypothetical protein [Mycolicibacterium iranicum]|uniref:Uncharacterized protein n=1 Tax=Mycolicibacterium iranicum TaxID=912594 RepID=A0ABT4HCQ2_MYCIR|nr:hypothetical protein [Mycolicibacterium iranicum]MCZ0727965.1 hypothetical protein [Mycolicibacterium iranicum]